MYYLYPNSYKAIYLDGRLSDEEVAQFPHVYNNFNEVMNNLVNGTAADPMVVYIAPYVYWIHDPDSPLTAEAYGIVKSCAYLHLIGLTEDARNVVIAANYGHNEGYYGGNWTMFNLSGDGLTLKNLTFGEYCNVDLVYPLDHSLDRAKRTDNITQGQIGNYSGDKLFAYNVRFISRLNMMPFISSRRALYYKCHMESTDDSLNGSSQAVYLECDFEFYSSKPWGGSSGVTLLNCDMKIIRNNVLNSVTQYLSKGAGRFNVIDSRFTFDGPDVPVYIGWSDILADNFRSYYSNVTVNGEPTTFDGGGKYPLSGIDITGTDFLRAYKLVDDDGNVIYNVYNLLRGRDGWDPLNQKEIVEALNGQDVATTLTVTASKTTIETGADSATVSFSLTGPQSTNYANGVTFEFIVSEAQQQYVNLSVSSDGLRCTVTGNNQEELPVVVIIRVVASTGHEAVAAITVKPSILPAPTFIEEPTVVQNEDGTAEVFYELDLGGRADMSRIIWSVSDSPDGSNPIEIAYGRGNNPLKKIELNKGYAGKYLIVSVEGKHIRSNYGPAVKVISSTPLNGNLIPERDRLTTDFSSFSTNAQTQLLDGFFTIDGYIPADTQPGYIPLDSTEVSTKYSATVNNWTQTNNNSWAYGTGTKNGVLDYSGIYQTVRGARLRYNAIGDTFGDMDVTLKLAPGKTASQGFGSDYQYMDIIIKFDNTTLTGFGLRIYRTSGDSCDFVLMEYRDGKNKEISDPVRSHVYLTECTVHIWTEGNVLRAHVETTQPQPQTAKDKGYAPVVDLTAEIVNNTYGDFCIQHTGTVGDNVTYIGFLDIIWKPIEQ